jgi:dihydropteroate synthase-like protein
MTRTHYLFVTGRLAEPSLRRVVEELAPAAGFDYSIAVLPITVAALMTPKWIAKRLKAPPGVTRVMVPGYCQGELAPVERAAGVPVELGPRDLLQLPEFFGRTADRTGYGEYDIQILAEINHAPRLSRDEILRRAKALAADGADLVDLGTDPQTPWAGVGDAVRALCDAGLHVSIDSRHPQEIQRAVRAGAELVLSVDGTNRRRAADWGREVVVVPDSPGSLDGLEQTLDFLWQAKVPLRIDPVLSPISFGFAESLGRYLEVRRRWPKAEMLMGVGNLTELTDADSAGLNVALLGFCQELGIRSVLTTQEINWAQTAVRECALARQLVHYAVGRHLLPKHVEPRLVMLRDPKLFPQGQEALERLARDIRDHAYRIFAEGGRLHLVGASVHLEGEDPFDLFDALLPRAPRPIDASHAFYLGYEMAKAATALILGKNYRQDEALEWGLLTRREKTRQERRALRIARRPAGEGCGDT